VVDLEQLHAFIVRAKAEAYVGGGKKSLAYRPDSHDLQVSESEFAYLDSYFGGTDFLGQEVVYWQGRAVWVMNYYGHILEPVSIGAADAGGIIQESLSNLYQERRFLGGFRHQTRTGLYIDTNEGDVKSFKGLEWIEKREVRVYELLYHGGLVKA
jgi:hypothetical protein